MVRNSSRIPRAPAVAVGLCVALGLALAAPVHAASPSRAAARIVASRLHKAGHARHMRPHRGR